MEIDPSENEKQTVLPEASTDVIVQGTETYVKNKSMNNQEVSLQQEVGISLEDIEISSNLAFKIAKDVLPENVKFLKDSKTALGKAATVFINYLSSAAQDVCLKAKRKQITPSDIFTALEMIEFSELVSPLTEFLDAQREITRAKKAHSAETNASQDSEHQTVHPMEE